MNCSMMYKRGAALLLALCLFSASFMTAGAEEALPEGEILIVYSDGAQEAEKNGVCAIAELLTYQGFQVTFAPASECAGRLGSFGGVIFYEVERYPWEMLEELWALERQAQAEWDKRGPEDSTEGIERFLIVGSRFLRTYLDRTGRSASYTPAAESAGRLLYRFSDSVSKEAVIRVENGIFLNGALDYRSGTLELAGLNAYFCARKGVLTHICAGGIDNTLIRAAFIREAAGWKWPYQGERPVYAQYIVLDRVYPFQDPDRLLDVIKLIAAERTPFVISVMPVYENGDYPAMQRFCEVLRYAQDNGAVILMHAPVNQMTEFDPYPVNDAITQAVGIYIAQGVYPLGLEAPRSWLFDNNGIEVMSRFSTILVSGEEDGGMSPAPDTGSNLVYKDSHQWIAPAIPLDEYGTSCVREYSTAVYFDITEDLEVIEDKLEACRSSFVPLKSLWDADHSLWTNEDTVSCKNRILLVNGRQTEITFEPAAYEEQFSYRRNTLQRFSKDLTEENKKLMAAVIAVSVLFLLFIAAARRNNRKRFFYPEEEEDPGEYWENRK